MCLKAMPDCLLELNSNPLKPDMVATNTTLNAAFVGTTVPLKSSRLLTPFAQSTSGTTPNHLFRSSSGVVVDIKVSADYLYSQG